MAQISKEELSVLAGKWLDGTITPAEKEIFDAWYEAQDDSQMIVETPDGDENRFSERLMARIQATTGKNKPRKPAPTPVIWIKTVAAAAAIILLIIGITYLWKQHLSAPANQKMTAQAQVTVTVPDLGPGGNKAILMLSDGRTILLDSAHTGQLTSLGNYRIIKQGSGQLVFQPLATAGINSTEQGPNTLKTPSGGKYQITLPDGTQVWLNAASSLTFPSNFTGNTREVKLTGEAYFEVVHNEHMPFIVKAGKTIIKDIGTRFNVMAYEDEAIKKVTLQEGAVEVTREGNSSNTQKQLLKPGQQLQVATTGAFKLIKHMDANAAISWKEGRFNFQDAKLVEVMRQLARWYDVEVIYQNGIPDLEFIGQVQRDLPLSEVLKGLKMSGVHFKLEKGRRLIVLP